MASVSIVIHCFNEEQHIGHLLDCIFQQTVRDVGVIVVDSGSTDNTLNVVTDYPVILLSIKPEEFPFGMSLNLGCRAATKEMIDSVHVYPRRTDWIENLIEPFADPRVALAYGGQRGGESTKCSERQILAKWFPEQSNPRQDGLFCNNANVAIRRDSGNLSLMVRI